MTHMESSDLFRWLKKIGLTNYCSRLWEAGFQDCASVASLTKDQLEAAGVRRRKVIDRLLRECNKLNGETALPHAFRHKTSKSSCVLERLERSGQVATSTVKVGQQGVVYQALYDYSEKE